MRLWSVAPQYLDSKGLVACWRESLLAQHVLLGQTVGYKNHPQLNRFRYNQNALSYYLYTIWAEAQNRGYNFDKNRIQNPTKLFNPVSVTDKQILYELNLLHSKISNRDESYIYQNDIWYDYLKNTK